LETESSLQVQCPDGNDQLRMQRLLKQYLLPFLTCVALVYGLIAGLRTVGDPDIGWQLATGRWIVQHRSIPYTDVFSYTVHGAEWIYPVLSQLLFYGVFVLGGYTLLSWLGAATTVGTVAMLVRRGQTPALILAILALPMVAERTTPRAEMFTELLFAAFVSILWHYHRSGRGPLWTLPILMCLWVNLHLGFIAGLGMCGAYIFLEAGDVIFGDDRTATVRRLRGAAPWLAVTLLATLLNPWGARLFVAVSRQNEINRLHNHWIGYWLSMRVTPAALADVFAWREPQSAVLWLMAASIVATLFALSMRRFATALLLGGSLYLAVHTIRFQGPFATIAVIVGGCVISDAIKELPWMRRFWSRTAIPAIMVTLVAVVSFVGVRSWDLVSNRYYLRTNLTSYFGTGESPWFPEQASDFLLREHLPQNIFNDFNSGGYLTWALSPTYADYIDGRAVPFGSELFMTSGNLLAAPLDSDMWRQEAGLRNINTIIVSIDRQTGAGALAALKTSCESQQWKPVHIDAEAAVFLRVQSVPMERLNQLQVDCNSVRFNRPPTTAGARGRAERFDYYLNAAAILLTLERYDEALEATGHAAEIFQENAFLHYARGVLFWNTGRAGEAEQELLRSVSLGSEDAATSLGVIYGTQRRYADQVSILTHAAERSLTPPLIYLRLGYAQIAMGRPDEALESFSSAEKWSPFGKTDPNAGQFWQMLEQGRAQASQMRAK